MRKDTCDGLMGWDGVRDRGGEETGCCKKLGLVIKEEEVGEERYMYPGNGVGE